MTLTRNKLNAYQKTESPSRSIDPHNRTAGTGHLNQGFTLELFFYERVGPLVTHSPTFSACRTSSKITDTEISLCNKRCF